MSKVEHIGSGIGKMISLMREVDLKEPVFEMETFFRVIFFRDPKYSLKREGIEKVREKGLVEGLVENQKKILELVKNNPKISKKDLSKKIGISTTAIDKNIISLKKKTYLNLLVQQKVDIGRLLEDKINPKVDFIDHFS